MARRAVEKPSIPPGPGSIEKGSNLGVLLSAPAVESLSRNLRLAWPKFDAPGFRRAAMTGLDGLGILDRGRHLAQVLHNFLPPLFDEAAEILISSLTPPQTDTDGLGLGVFFYLPHVTFAGTFGHDAANNGGRDPFEAAMRLQYELTRRFSAEFSIRQFIIRDPVRTFARLMEWTRDDCPHVRRLCSEGSRPRLPWAVRIPALVKDPRPALPVLEALKDDPSLYVRRSVANHVGDIAKDHPALAFELCGRWASGASEERRWIIRHAVRLPAKKGVAEALSLRVKCAPYRKAENRTMA